MRNGISRRLLFLLFVTMLFLLPGCFLEDMSCGFFDNPDHCYQWWAVQREEPDTCEKIPGTGWEGQNPPKDKCYVKIAADTGDPEHCLGTEGGMNGYDRNDCYTWMGQDGHSADSCEEHSYEADCRSGIAQAGSGYGGTPDCGDGWSWSGGACAPDKPEEKSDDKSDDKLDDATDEKEEKTDKVETPPLPPVLNPEKETPDEKDEKNDEKTEDKDDDKDSETDTPKDEKKEESADTETKDDKKDDKADEKEDKRSGLEQAVDTLADVTDKIDKAGEKAEELKNDLINGVKGIFTGKPEEPTPKEEQQVRLSELVKDVEDQDARSAIIEAFMNERKRQDDMTIEQQRELLEDIKDNYEFGVAMDEKADRLKADTVDKLTGKVDELVNEKKEGAWNWIKDKTYGWVKGRTPEKYKEAAALAESRYNKAAEKYNDALGSYKKGKDYFDRAKKAYDEMKQVMDNVRRLQDKVKSGRITEGQASAIKGGVLLGKGLEYTTKYIPVFGETISEVTAGTFQATMKFAEKRAERTTRLNACIDDPENCDPNGISAY